ncbi:hypothetical protein C8J55DRAFT_494608 [Lentinula edodes]|uniref:Uncharacterized protein n=1 Tax=Lentinula lateritia TaxID=40482 RepID=A0A9W9E0P3_9AGAR|nr:hypothetical protein C8J55DRAFT_494608 [Lentinula edodes]
MASNTNKSFVNWQTNGENWMMNSHEFGSPMNLMSKSFAGQRSEAEKRSIHPATSTIGAASSSTSNPHVPYQASRTFNYSSSNNSGYGGWTGSISGDAGFNTSRGDLVDFSQSYPTERVFPSNVNETTNPSKFKQWQPPMSNFEKRAEHNPHPATNGRGGRAYHTHSSQKKFYAQSIVTHNGPITPGKGKNKQVSPETTTHNLSRNNWSNDSTKKSQRPINKSYPSFPSQHSIHPPKKPSVQVRKGVPHAEDLQPNEGFTGVKTTVAPGVPKVLSTSSKASKNGNTFRGGWIPKRGNWTSKRGRWGDQTGKQGSGRNPNQPVRLAQPSSTSSDPSSSSSLDPGISTPHRLPPTALSKALNNHHIIPQKRKISPNPDPAASISSSSLMSISTSGSSAPSGSTGKDFSHLLPAGPWKNVKRRKIQEQESRQEDEVPQTRETLKKELANTGEIVVADGQFMGGGPVNVLDHDLMERNAGELKVESIDNSFQLVYPPSSPAPSRPSPSNVLPATSITHSNSQKASSQSSSGTTIVKVTPISTSNVKDEPLDVALTETTKPNNPTSGTKRYHPIPSSCLKFFSVPSINASFPNILSSSSSSKSQRLGHQLIPNPHFRTARAEFTKRAVAELRAEGLVVLRVLWRDDGFCVDWEKLVVRENAAIGAGELNGGNGKEGASDMGTRKEKGAENRNGQFRTMKQVSSLKETRFDNLYSMEDGDSQDKSEPLPDPGPTTETWRPRISGSPPHSRLKTGVDANVDFIDLTLDEETPIPPVSILPNPSNPDPSPGIGSKENVVVENEDVHRSDYKPPLLVRLGSGRTPNVDSFRPVTGRTSSPFLRDIPPHLKPRRSSTVASDSRCEFVKSSSELSELAVPLDSKLIKLELENQSTPIVQSQPIVPPAVRTVHDDSFIGSPGAQSLSAAAEPHNDSRLEGIKVNQAICEPPRDVDDPGDVEEEMQVRDELGLDLHDVEVRLDSEDDMDNSRPLEQSSEPAVELPKSTKGGSSQVEREDARDFGFSSANGRIERLVVDRDEKVKMEQLTLDFLQRYINSWEYDRRSLSSAYAPNAVFSCSVVLPETSSEISFDSSPTHAFASHFVTSTSAYNFDPSTSASSRPVQGPPILIQTPTVITPALLLLDPQRAYTFFPRGRQAEVAYDILYLGTLGNSEQCMDGNKKSLGVLVYLGVQAELKRRIPEADDDILNILTSSNMDEKEKERSRAGMEGKLCLGWNFVLRAGGVKDDDNLSLQIVSHQMLVRDGL